VAVRARFLCDWAERPASLSLEPAEGSQTVKAPSATLKSLSWGRAVYEIEGVIQPYRSGKLGEGELKASFSKGSGKPAEFVLKIPAFEAAPVKTDPDAKLSLAGKLSAKTPAWVWPSVAAAILLLIAFGAWLLWKRLNKPQPPLPPWTLRLASDPASAPSCLAELTDVLRRYLEARFKLHARTQTSFEFLSSLERGGGPLSEAHRSFLKEFLVAADMVKFALASADRRLLEDALLRAGKLVQETVPLEEPDVKKKGGGK
jgi:hypothetical protein